MADASVSGVSNSTPAISPQDQQALQDILEALVELKHHGKAHGAHGAHEVKSLDPFNNDDALPSGAEVHDLITQLHALLTSSGSTNSDAGPSNSNSNAPATIQGASN